MARETEREEKQMEETFEILRRLHQTRRKPGGGGAEEDSGSGTKACKPEAVASRPSRR